MPRRTALKALAFSFLVMLPAAGDARAAPGDGLRVLLKLAASADEGIAKAGVDFFDLAVAASITGKPGIDGLLPMATRIHLPHFGEMLGMAQAWKEKAGFALADVEAFASAGAPPDALHFIRLMPSVRLEDLTTIWTARGFRETASGGVALWGRGEPRTLDLTKIDPADPFGGNLGRSSFLLPALPWIAEAFGPEPLARAKRAASDGALTGRADVAALLAALDRESGQLLQAKLLTDPAASMTKEGDLIAFTAFLLGDFEAGEQAATLILLALRECGVARAVRTFIEQGWAAQPPAVSVHEPVWTLRQGAICVLIGRIAAPGAAAARNFGNVSYRTLIDAWTRRELTAFVLSPDR